MVEKISVIIPTKDTPKYLDECITSILNQKNDYDIEVILGIDNCEKTLNHIKNNKLYSNIDVYYFYENVGPYIIKNNLIDLAKNEHILFFDSDDIMIEGMLSNFKKTIEECDYVMFNLLNFIDNDITKTTNDEIAKGVIGIKKSIFNKFVGYESWMCNADEEFLERMDCNGVSKKIIATTSFYRRRHDLNLTIKSSTNLKSNLRKKYREILNRKRRTRNWSNPVKLIKEFKKINDEI